jgi:Fe-S-cluster containining protein
MGEAKRRKPGGFDLASGFTDAERRHLNELRAGAFRYARTMLLRARDFAPEEQRRHIAVLHREGVRALDAATADFLKNAPAGPAIAAKIACRRGCSYCCYSQVEVSIVEAIAVADAIATDGQLAASVRSTAPAVRGLSALARMQAHVPCPLLRDGACSVYADRPRSCRALTSYDAKACEEEFRSPDVERPPRPAFTWPRYLATALTSGVAAACADLTLQSNTVELIGGVAAVLDDQTIVRRWLAGDAVFPSAPA